MNEENKDQNQSTKKDLQTASEIQNVSAAHIPHEVENSSKIIAPDSSTEMKAQKPIKEEPSEDKKNSQPDKCLKINNADWNDKKITLNKKFYSVVSPKLLFTPFSLEIDIQRAKTKAIEKGYQIAENPMVLSTNSMFISKVMIEVAEANDNDKDVISLYNKEFYSRVTDTPWIKVKADLDQITGKIGKKTNEAYFVHNLCDEKGEKSTNKKIILARVS